MTPEMRPIKVQVTFDWVKPGPLDLGASTYMPHLVVTSDLLGVCFTGGPSHVTPNMPVEAEVTPMYSEVDYSALVPGANFLVLEGPRTVGRGKVLHAL